MYKPRARGIDILPYALPGVTGLVIGLSVFWFRLVMGFCFVDSDDSDAGSSRSRLSRKHFSGDAEDFAEWKFTFLSYLRRKGLHTYLKRRPRMPGTLEVYKATVRATYDPASIAALGDANAQDEWVTEKANEDRDKALERYHTHVAKSTRIFDLLVEHVHGEAALIVRDHQDDPDGNQVWLALEEEYGESDDGTRIILERKLQNGQVFDDGTGRSGMMEGDSVKEFIRRLNHLRTRVMAVIPDGER